MSDIDRIDAFIKTLREASKTEPPYNYGHGNPTDKLITLTGNTHELCWELAAATKTGSTSNKATVAASIKHNATNIINICITELKNLGHTSETAIELIATDGALWFWDINNHPLNKLDRDVSPANRIQSIYVTTGNLMEWWPADISPQNPIETAEILEQAFINLAYEATYTIIAHTN
nr:MAG TPA: hypothetical protein [Caudoviricetes sp.]